MFDKESRSKLVNVTDQVTGTKFCAYCHHHKPAAHGTLVNYGRNKVRWACASCESRLKQLKKMG